LGEREKKKTKKGKTNPLKKGNDFKENGSGGVGPLARENKGPLKRRKKKKNKSQRGGRTAPSSG